MRTTGEISRGFFAVLGLAYFSASCGNPADFNIAVLRAERQPPTREWLVELIRRFAGSHPQPCQSIVLWSSPALDSGNAFYLPVQNDIRGIGYGSNGGRELFDDSAEFGLPGLQGVVWMGARWADANDEEAIAGGPRSLLGVLAHETAHRWGATVRTWKEPAGAGWDLLAPDHLHWSALLDTGGSPLGGNRWDEGVEPGTVVATPVNEVLYGDLDLYLMGLLTVDEVRPARRLVEVAGSAQCPEVSAEPEAGELPEGAYCEFMGAARQLTAVRAQFQEITVAEVIGAEGARTPASWDGQLRQCWVYVSEAPPNREALARLSELRHRWEQQFQRATRGRAKLDTILPPSASLE